MDIFTIYMYLLLIYTLIVLFAYNLQFLHHVSVYDRVIKFRMLWRVLTSIVFLVLFFLIIFLIDCVIIG